MAQSVKRALVSVFDKDGIVEFCQGLAALDVEILSSGGTARTSPPRDRLRGSGTRSGPSAGRTARGRSARAPHARR